MGSDTRPFAQKQECDVVDHQDEGGAARRSCPASQPAARPGWRSVRRVSPGRKALISAEAWGSSGGREEHHKY